MWKLLADYLLVNRTRIAIDLIKVYLGALLIAAALFSQAAIHNSADKLVPKFSLGVLIALAPGLVMLASHLIAGVIAGFRIARTSGVPLDEYIKTETYQSN